MHLWDRFVMAASMRVSISTQLSHLFLWHMAIGHALGNLLAKTQNHLQKGRGIPTLRKGLPFTYIVLGLCFWAWEVVSRKTLLIHREDNPLEGSEVLFCQTLGAAFYGGKCTSALFMAPVGHLELVNLAFQTPSQQLFGEDVCNKHHTHTHARTPPHTPPHSFSNPLWFFGCTRVGQRRLCSEPNSSLLYGLGTLIFGAFTSSDDQLGKKKLPGQCCPRPQLPGWVPCGEPFTLSMKCDHLCLLWCLGWFELQCSVSNPQSRENRTSIIKALSVERSGLGLAFLAIKNSAGRSRIKEALLNIACASFSGRRSRVHVCMCMCVREYVYTHTYFFLWSLLFLS